MADDDQSTDSTTHKLKWNGSYIGVIDVLSIDKGYPYKFIEFKWNNSLYSAAFHLATNVYACLVDEIAPLFRLPKLGTHVAKWNGKSYVIYKMSSGQPRLLTNAAQDKMTIKRKRQIQDVFVFRMIMGLGTNSENSIIITKYGPASYRNRLDFRKPCQSHYISDSISKHWFVDGFSNSFKRMGVLEEEDIFKLRKGISEIIKRLAGDDTFGLEAQIMTALSTYI